MKLKMYLFLLLIFCGNLMIAQQDAQYTNYMYNTLQFNPAYTGSKAVLSVFGLHRSQWVGLTGAPVTSTFSIQSPLGNQNLGLGLSVINDRIGPSDETNISTNISYFVPISANFNLAFGLSASANLFGVDYTKLKIRNLDDGLLAQNRKTEFSPNFGAGLFLYSDKTYFGISVPSFLETTHFDKKQTNFNINALATECLHFYMIAGKVFDLNSDLLFKPSMLAKIVTGAPLQIDVSANFMYLEKVVVGAAYRWDAAVSGLLGFQVSKSWFIGYAYDTEVTKLENYNSGSHEIFLRFEAFSGPTKIIAPRFF